MATASSSAAAAPGGARHALTIATRVVLGLVSLGVLVQFFLIGLALMPPGQVHGDALDAHRSVGGIVHGLTILSFLLAVAGPRTRFAMLGTLGLAVLTTVQVAFNEAESGVRGLHPALALFVVGLAGFLGSRIGRAAATDRAARRA